MSEDIVCNYCGRQLPPFVISDDALVCMNCYQQFYTCRMCEMGHLCEFETNPSPSPKVVFQTIRQGPMVIQHQVKNPQRVEQFCHKCLCWNTEKGYCGKEDGWCKKYHELRPPYREQRQDVETTS
jgi:hypothetical protein